MNFKFLLPIIFSLVLSGCATNLFHPHSHGAVVLLDDKSKTTGQVCLGSDDVKVGQQLHLHKVTCISEETMNPKMKYRRICNKTEIGLVEITEVMDKHFSSVKLIRGEEIEVGLIVEAD